jgi:hypothetical protein
MVSGCWWFLNIPSLIEEMTSMRLELLRTLGQTTQKKLSFKNYRIFYPS